MSKYSNEERTRIYGAWKQSGLSLRKFCQENAICISTFYGWVRKFKNTAGEENLAISSKAVKFLPIGNIVSARSSLEIILPSGINLKVNLPEEKINTFLEGLIK